MGMQLVAGAEQFFVIAVLVLYRDGAGEDRADQLFAGFGIGGNGNVFHRIEAADDFLAGGIAHRAQENRAEDFFLAVNFGKNEVLFLVDFKFKPGAMVRDDAA